MHAVPRDQVNSNKGRASELERMHPVPSVEEAHCLGFYGRCTIINRLVGYGGRDGRLRWSLSGGRVGNYAAGIKERNIYRLGALRQGYSIFALESRPRGWGASLAVAIFCSRVAARSQTYLVSPYSVVTASLYMCGKARLRRSRRPR